MEYELRNKKDPNYLKRFEEFLRAGNAIYARETNRAKLNNAIIEFKIKMYKKIEKKLKEKIAYIP